MNTLKEFEELEKLGIVQRMQQQQQHAKNDDTNDDDDPPSDPPQDDDPPKEDDDGDDPKGDATDLNAIAEKLAEERLKEIKKNLDKAFKERDEEKKEKIAITAELEEARKAIIEKEGEYVQKIAEEKTKLEEENQLLKQRLSNQERTTVINNSLSDTRFVNSFAKDQAVEYLKNQVKQESDGKWRHSSGVDLQDYVDKVMQRDERMAFWFEPKTNSGPRNNKSNNDNITSQGILDSDGKAKFSTEQLLKMASRGQIEMDTGT